jgi:dihydropyrimidinase
LGHFAESRPVEAETVATERAIAMCRATRAPTYIVHLSSARALAACAAARAEGLPLYVETRPLYLHMTADRYRGPEGALYVAQPPLRDRADQESLWRGLVDGTIDTIASDHAPWTRELKMDPKLDVANCRSGVAELDTMLPLLYTEGVMTGLLSPERFVALTSTNAARLFGMYPRKGTIAVGSDADIAVWETRERRTLRDEDLFSRAGHSVYAGRELRAWPAATLRRGELVFENGKVLGRPGSGRPIGRGPTAAPRRS